MHLPNVWGLLQTHWGLLQAFLDLSLLDAQDVKVPFLQAKKQGQAALLNYSRRTLEEQVEKGFENKGKVSSRYPPCHWYCTAASLVFSLQGLAPS